MTLPEIVEFILLPCVGWLLLNSNANQRRLTRIEILLEMFITNHTKQKTEDEN